MTSTDASGHLRFVNQFTGYWAVEAAHAIVWAHVNIPEDATLEARMAAIDAAYPFGPRSHHPYKQWLKVRAAYLAPYGYQRKGTPKVGKVRTELQSVLPVVCESPLERMKRRAGAA